MVKITALPRALALADADRLPIVQGDSTRVASVESLFSAYVRVAALNAALGAERADRGTAIATAIADLVGRAPGALDTPNELAAVLGDDLNFAATITNLLTTERVARSTAIDALRGAPSDEFVLNTLKRLSDAIGDDPNLRANVLQRFDGLDGSITTTNERIAQINALVSAEVKDRIRAVQQEQQDRSAAIAPAIAGLVDIAPGTLDTLNELAAALGDDPNFAATITNLLTTERADRVAAISALRDAPPGDFFLNTLKRLSDALSDDPNLRANILERFDGLDGTIRTTNDRVGVVAGATAPLTVGFQEPIFRDRRGPLGVGERWHVPTRDYVQQGDTIENFTDPVRGSSPLPGYSTFSFPPGVIGALYYDLDKPDGADRSGALSRHPQFLESRSRADPRIDVERPGHFRPPNRQSRRRV